MDIYNKTALDLMREAGATFKIGDESATISLAGLRNLELFVGELRSKYESLLDVVLAVGTAPLSHRFSKKELKKHHKALTHRIKHVHDRVGQKRAEGVPRENTSFDRDEVAALGVALALLEAALQKAIQDEADRPGGTLLGLLGPHPETSGPDNEST